MDLLEQMGSFRMTFVINSSNSSVKPAADEKERGRERERERERETDRQTADIQTGRCGEDV